MFCFLGFVIVVAVVVIVVVVVLLREERVHLIIDYISFTSLVVFIKMWINANIMSLTRWANQWINTVTYVCEYNVPLS